MTKENAHLFLPLVQALADGKTIEMHQRKSCSWIGMPELDFSFPPDKYRIKPEPVLVPLGPEDVPPGSAFRWPEWSDGAWKITHEIDRERIYFPCGVKPAGNSSTYEDLMWESVEIQRPGEDWTACSKPG